MRRSPPTDEFSPPPLDAQERQLHEEVFARIRDACESEGGDIGFDRFMEIALYAPGVGYYSAPRARFGPSGDFVTAPEISPRFGACVARAAAPVLLALGDASVLEAGAGSGALARQIIVTLDALAVPFERYLILERSASARAAQRDTLGPLAGRVHWLDDLPEAGFRGVVVANELLDALPARRFRVVEDGLEELRIATQADALVWRTGGSLSDPDGRELARALAVLPPLPAGYVSEFAPGRGAWVRSLAARLQSGLVLLADYGYPRAEFYHPQRHGGTLRCYRRHRAHDDPLPSAGVEDISVHVDFTAVAEAGLAAGLRCVGFTTQAHFLLENGLLEGMDDPALPERERASAAHAVRQLTLPMEMGEAVKFLALGRGELPVIPGFSGRDLRPRLG